MPDPKLEWHEAARADLRSIIDYVSDDNPDAAQKLRDDIDEKAGRLVAHPKLYETGRLPGTREMPVRRSYIVVYAEDGQRVTILRVLHAAQIWPR